MRYHVLLLSCHVTTTVVGENQLRRGKMAARAWSTLDILLFLTNGLADISSRGHRLRVKLNLLHFILRFSLYICRDGNVSELGFFECITSIHWYCLYLQVCFCISMSVGVGIFFPGGDRRTISHHCFFFPSVHDCFTVTEIFSSKFLTLYCRLGEKRQFFSNKQL